MKNLAKIDDNILDISSSQNNLPFSIDATVFTYKVTTEEAKELRFIGTTGSLINLAEHFTSGKCFCPVVYRHNYRAGANFIRQQIFCQDFDGEMTLSEAKAILEEHNLTYNIGYYTYRHSDQVEKFRLLFLFDGVIESEELANKINKGLHRLFHFKTDSIALDTGRFWNGTNKGYFVGDITNEINLNYFLEVIAPFQMANDSGKMRGVAVLGDGILKKKCPETGNLLYINNSKTQIKTEKKPIKKIENFKIEDLLQYKIFKEFYDGRSSDASKIKLKHNELVGLASNLIYLHGGSNIWKKCIAKNTNYSPEKEKIYNYVLNRLYNPYHFSTFSPYEEDKTNYFQTFKDALIKKGQIQSVIKNNLIEQKLLTVTEARIKLDAEYRRILNRKDNKVYLFNCATGLGKTQIIKNTKGVAIAFPDHALKDEQFNSSILAFDYKFKTPEAKGFSNELQEHFNFLYQTGFNDFVYDLIKDIAQKKQLTPNIPYTSTDVDRSRKFLEQLEDVSSSFIDNTVFTTHQRAILKSFSHQTLIFDESPLSVLIQQGSILLKDIEKLVPELIETGEEQIVKQLRELLNTEDKSLSELQYKLVDKKKLYTAIKKGNIKSNIIALLEADYIIKVKDRIHYCKNNVSNLPADKKIIIADATAPIEIYKLLFGERLEVIDITNVEMKGKIIQYTNYSCSRTGLKKYGEQLSKLIDPWPVITFKGLKHFFKSASQDVHFGKSRGTNILEGQNLNVVGTSHYGLPYYMFLAKVCGLPVEDFEMKNRKVQFNNYEFTFPTFDDEKLQKFHLELVEGDLVQAVQRARLVNHAVTVKVYSNLPLKGAQHIWTQSNVPEIEMIFSS